MEWIGHWSAWLNDTMVKTIMLMIGGFILKKWPAFVTKSVPVTLTIVSALLATIHALFPGVGSEVAPASFAFTSFAGIGMQAAASPVTRGASWVWNTLAPLAFAIGAQSGSKNTREWFKLGVGFFWPNGRPPR